MARLSSDAGISRRTELRVVLSGTGLALLAACGPASPQAAQTPSAPAPTAAGAASVVAAQPSAPQQPKTGGTIHYAGLDDITSLDGHKSSSPGFDTMYQI